ncbi:MAG: DUF763 domain-containing protein [Deltaproteobacteria bacterium]|nr:DUF763 domain-containing protein [Candidatus Zymogenaceae bacterium]
MAPRRTTATLPLHGGKAPAWLMQRMIRLAREIVVILVAEYGSDEVLRRLADPFWFQSLGCVLGFDWHSSGVTTTVSAAVKQGIAGMESDLNLFAAGGKGGRSRNTPDEITAVADRIDPDPEKLVYLSRLSAKVDNNAVMDGYQIYLHHFFFTREGRWSVVQQGMNDANGTARRYHWLGDDVNDMVVEPHSAICCDAREETVTNLTDTRSDAARTIVTDLSHERPDTLTKDLTTIKGMTLPRRHHIISRDIHPDRLYKIMLKTYERRPEDFETLLASEGVGPKTIRALSLIAEVIHGANASFSDPARFSYAHGGKDGHPYPVDRENYDTSIDILRRTTQSSRIERTEKIKALKRLDRFYDRFTTASP